MMQETIREAQPAAGVPRRPGVYLFADAHGEILYVGKARDLRRRVRSYFRAARTLQFKTRALMQRARDMEVLVVGTEWDALLLEARLIRSLRPRYNTRLKDSRGYPFLRIALEQPPHVGLVERVKRDGADYFGPIPEAASVHGALEVIRRLYTLRTATFERGRTDGDACRMAADVLALLRGRGQDVCSRIEHAMHAAAAALDFERAIRMRNALTVAARIPAYPRVRPGSDELGRGVAVVSRFAFDIEALRGVQA